MPFPTLLKRSAPSKMLVWRRRSWARYLQATCALMTLLLFLGFQKKIASRVSSFQFLGPDKLHNDILNSTLGFEKIFVLNLPTRSDRRDALSLAASFGNIKLDWIDGVFGNDVLEKALPPGYRLGLSTGGRGSWRAHMNAIRSIVDQNLGSALILEDDIDWDIRLKTQLQTFALASQALLSEDTQKRNHLRGNWETHRPEYQKISFPLTSLPFPPRPKSSPYGDDWDMLWLGHCGIAFHDKPPSSRIIIPNDQTVPEAKYLKPHPFGSPDKFGSLYPPHTRVVHHAAGSSCSLAYALSQRGARKLLYEFGVKAFDKQIDFMFGEFCENIPDIEGTRSGIGRGESEGVCITVQPPLFSHHYPEVASSDIYEIGGGFVTMIGTLYMRWSVRMNLGRLVRGLKDFVDQWPDETR